MAFRRMAFSARLWPNSAAHHNEEQHEYRSLLHEILIHCIMYNVPANAESKMGCPGPRFENKFAVSIGEIQIYRAKSLASSKT